MCKLIQPHTFKRSLVYIVSCMLSSLYTHTLCVMLKTRKHYNNTHDPVIERVYCMYAHIWS